MASLAESQSIYPRKNKSFDSHYIVFILFSKKEAQQHPLIRLVYSYSSIDQNQTLYHHPTCPMHNVVAATLAINKCFCNNNNHHVRFTF